MTCPKCGNEMFIDEWSAWYWTCPVCDHIDRAATKEEIKELESNG